MGDPFQFLLVPPGVFSFLRRQYRVGLRFLVLALLSSAAGSSFWSWSEIYTPAAWTFVMFHEPFLNTGEMERMLASLIV
jgi:hypothetical protein